MHLFPLLRQRMTGEPRNQRTPMFRPQACFRLLLETLEFRSVPGTLTVTNNLDIGTGSLWADSYTFEPVLGLWTNGGGNTFS